MKCDSIPVLYYHRVGAPDPVHLSISIEGFDRQMAFLKRRGYNVISAKELIDWMAGDLNLKMPAVCLTFDDGFVDNLLYADPILEKYGFKAALFVATDLIRPESQKAAEKVDEFNTAHTKARRGDLSNFMSLNELKTLENTGRWEIYSHSAKHNQVFVSKEKTGIYPKTDNHWGILSAYNNGCSSGEWPVFKRQAGLVTPGFVKCSQGKDSSIDSEESIQVGDIFLKKEKQTEYLERIENDLTSSLKIIEKEFIPKPKLICWPWGKTNETLEKVAVKVGYTGAFRTDTGANFKGMNPMKIRRFPIKKEDLFRFSLGLWLRKKKVFADIYAFFRNKD